MPSIVHVTGELGNPFPQLRVDLDQFVDRSLLLLPGGEGISGERRGHIRVALQVVEKTKLHRPVRLLIHYFELGTRLLLLGLFDVYGILVS